MLLRESEKQKFTEREEGTGCYCHTHWARLWDDYSEFTASVCASDTEWEEDCEGGG